MWHHLRKEIVKKQSHDRKPVAELAAATKTALGELRKAITSFQSRAAKRTAGASAGGDRSKKAKTGNTKFLLDGGVDLATAISTHQARAVEADPFAIFKGALDVPVMVTLSESDRECVKTPAVVAAVDYFTLAFTSKVKKERFDLFGHSGISALLASVNSQSISLTNPCKTFQKVPSLKYSSVCFDPCWEDEQSNAQKPLDKRIKTRAAAKIGGDAGQEVSEMFKKFFIRQGMNPAYEGCDMCEPFHFGVQGRGLQRVPEMDETFHFTLHHVQSLEIMSAPISMDKAHIPVATYDLLASQNFMESLHAWAGRWKRDERRGAGTTCLLAPGASWQPHLALQLCCRCSPVDG